MAQFLQLYSRQHLSVTENLDYCARDDIPATDIQYAYTPAETLMTASPQRTVRALCL